MKDNNNQSKKSWNRELTGADLVKIFVPVIFMVGFKQLVSPMISQAFAVNSMKNFLTEAKTEYSYVQQLEQYEPDVYQRMETELLDASRNERGQQEISNIVKRHVESVLPKYLPVASDEALIDFAEVVNTTVLDNPDICQAYLAQGSVPSNTSLTDTQQQNFDEIMADVIKTGAENPTNLTTEDINLSQTALDDVITDLQATHGEDLAILANLKDENVDKQKACTIVSDLYEGILELPAEQSAMALRLIFSNQ